MSKNPFKGEILLSCHSGQSKKKLKFNETPINFELHEVLMSQFCEIPLSPSEKRELTLSRRKEIQTYRYMVREKLKKYQDRLVEKILNHPSSLIQVKASDFGSYICLGTLFSGEIPQNKKIHFILKKAPFNAFPQELICSSSFIKKVKVEFDSNDVWLKEFKSLSDPRYFPHQQLKKSA